MDTTPRRARFARLPVVLLDLDAPIPALTPSMPFVAFAVWFLRSVRPRLKVRSFEVYELNLRRYLLPGLGTATPLADITRARIRDLLEERGRAGYAAATRRLMLSTIRALLNAAVEEELIPKNPALRLGRGLPRRVENPREKAMPPEHVARFLAVVEQAHPDFAPFFLFLARTGARFGEALAVQWPDVNLTERLLSIERTVDWNGRIGTPKSGHVRVVDLSAELTAALTALRATADPAVPWVFYNPDTGRPWSRSAMRHLMAIASARAAIPHAAPHQLRHGFASTLADNGASPWAIRDLLGHADLRTTEGYVRLRHLHRSIVDQLDKPVAGPVVSVPSMVQAPTPSATAPRPVLRQRATLAVRTSQRRAWRRC